MVPRTNLQWRFHVEQLICAKDRQASSFCALAPYQRGFVFITQQVKHTIGYHPVKFFFKGHLEMDGVFTYPVYAYINVPRDISFPSE